MVIDLTISFLVICPFLFRHYVLLQQLLHYRYRPQMPLLHSFSFLLPLVHIRVKCLNVDLRHIRQDDTSPFKFLLYADCVK